MAVLKITYPNKTNNPTDADNIRKFQFGDANEIKNALNNNADELETVLAALGINQGSNSIGSFVSLTLLQAAYPDGANGSYAIIDDGLGGTPQIATYNSGTAQWELSVPDGSIIWVANQAALPNPGIAQKLYIALDSGDFFYWTGSQFETAGPSLDVVTKYILNNGNRYYTEKGYGNSANNFQVGDMIRYRNSVSFKMYFYYVKNADLTLPADFADRTKLDQYTINGPSL
ncbi:hypothetical protein L0P88_04090 [Muricauda sp. SCSIO 64092]|uniref:hypothetical protein n=1 Tax=Allomuricauda sp. SCSIO 64092 TaxID=2908842 RepID=UPI001FF1A115|nr:hypothetical protein [Muricauda sp. SCSIO 64092]UOY07735.1 hypothetical protein L0P88_04090 [Muricauda sp. SCSIO 64092]